ALGSERRAMIQRKPDFARLGEPCALSASALAVADRTELRRLHPRVPHASHHTEVHALDALAGGIAVELPVTRLEGPAERAGVASPGPAVGDQREVPEIVAALDGHQAERPQHVRVRDLHHTLRHLDGREPEPAAQGLDGGRGAIGIETDRAAVDAAGIEVAEDEVGVGDCRLRPAEAVTRRPRRRARCAAAATPAAGPDAAIASGRARAACGDIMPPAEWSRWSTAPGASRPSAATSSSR